MAEEIDFENGRNSNFEGLVTLTFDPAIRHIVVQQSSTSTYIANFIQIEETFYGRTDVRMDGRTDVRTGGRTFFPSILLGQLSEVDLTNWMQQAAIHMMIHPIEVLAFSHTVESWARKSKKQQLFNFLLTSAVDGKLINSSCSSSACLECFATRMSFSAWTLSNYKH